LFEQVLNPGRPPLPRWTRDRPACYNVLVQAQTEPVRSGAPSPGLRRFLFLTAAIGGAAVLVVEILGAKMLAPYVGTSHYVWTAQIAVTLVSLAAGYAAGGWLADRSPRLYWIYWALVLAAAWLGGATIVCEPVAFACLRFRLAAGSLLASAALYFVPLALLAMIGPFLVRVLTISVSSVGTTMGRLTAISTLGSVGGTLLIGYVLIPLLPNSGTMFATAGTLVALSAVYFLVWERSQLPPAAVAGGVAALLGFLGTTQLPFGSIGGMREVHRRNSNFGLMQVLDAAGGARRFFLNDLLMQNGYLTAERRSASLFTYMLHDLARAYGEEIREVLCIGMGIGIVPRQFAEEGARVDVVEINPTVVPIARQYFDFRPEILNLHIGDGRHYLRAGTNRYDAVVLDAFLGESPPSHLMTREAFQDVRRRLRPEGVLVMNTFCKFESGKDFLVASLDRTLKAVFRSVRIHAAGSGNVFFVASDRANLGMRQAPDLSRVPSDIQPTMERMLASTETVDARHGRILTDDYNPVEVRDAANREELRRRLAVSYRSPL
jgi:predicted membrane-bound spermidine synthase